MTAGHQRQLVVDVALLAAVPVQVFREDVQNDGHVRTHATARHFAGLVAGQFNCPVFRRRLRVQHLKQRQADIADQAGAMAGSTQQVRQQRGSGALALGTGHTDRIGQRTARIGVLAEPQRGTADELRTLPQRVLRLGLVRTDAGRLDHHVEARQRLAAYIGFHLQDACGFGACCIGLSSRTEQGQRECWQPRLEYMERGTALTAPAPQRDALAFKLRNSHADAPTMQPGCGVRLR